MYLFQYFIINIQKQQTYQSKSTITTSLRVSKLTLNRFRSLIEHLCNLLEKNGTDFWWTLPINELFPVHLLSEHNLKLDDIEQGQVSLLRL